MVGLAPPTLLGAGSRSCHGINYTQNGSEHELLSAVFVLDTRGRAELYISVYLKQPQDARYISEHACKCGATSLLDHLDAERSYRVRATGLSPDVGLLSEICRLQATVGLCFPVQIFTAQELEMKPFTLVCLVTLFTAGLACAQQGTPAPGGQDTAALEQKVRDLEDRLIALEGQVRGWLSGQGAESRYQHDWRLCGVCGGQFDPALAVARNARVGTGSTGDH